MKILTVTVSRDPAIQFTYVLYYTKHFADYVEENTATENTHATPTNKRPQS